MTTAKRVHDALGGYASDEEIIVRWVVVAEVACFNGDHYLMHRAGGGDDGADQPMAWTALGMMRAGARLAEDQVADLSGPVDE